MKNEDVSEKTRRLITIINETPLPELVGVKGSFVFPRPTLDELHLLATCPDKLPRERRMVIEAYEGRLYQNTKAVQGRYAESRRTLDKKIAELLSN